LKFLTVRELRDRSAQVWRDLPQVKEMVITSNGRPIAMLAAVNEANLEQSLTAWRGARAAQTVTAIQLASARRGTDKLTMDEIDAEIAAARRVRRKRAP
jgi:antitoxin (DNA-binding transcriptional repressor) of toxin-antitoxin stability system